MTIEVRRLSFSYRDKDVLRDVNLTIHPGKPLSLLGPNGAGKTTLLNVVAGLLAAKEGGVYLNGTDVKQLTPREVARHMSYVPQLLSAAFDYSVLDYVVTGSAPHLAMFERPKDEDYETARQAIAEMGITHLSEKSYAGISGGERQQVAIARAIAQRPEYILMDEPTSHLDYGNQIKVLRIIRRLSEKGFGVVFTTHNPEHALLLGGSVAVLDREGHLKVGDSETLLDAELLSRLYDTELRSMATESRRVVYAPGIDSHGERKEISADET